MTQPAPRSGFAALLGRPNVGKSTLLNKLIGEKIAIVSPKPQTTRSRILGVVTRGHAQVSLLDTPGLHQAKGALNKFMVDVALQAASECDVVLFLIEAEGKTEEQKVDIGSGNRFVLEQLKKLGKPTLLVINKIDQVEKRLLLPLIDRYSKEFSFAEVMPISAREGKGVDELFDLIVSHLPEGEHHFPPDVFTDQAERTLVAEYVREQVLRHCRQEVPYSTAVIVEHFDESDRGEPGEKRGARGLSGLVRIMADIYVERDSQKAIVIGKRGAMLKTIGTDARKSIERLLGANVYLSLQVKVEPRWTERPQALHRMGYQHGR